MKIIKKIRIENFRSFLGTRGDDLAEVLDVTDLNIFSGANDSGKSNILRALNLFFNDEVSREKKFFHKIDLNINKRDAGNRVVKIQIFFDISWDLKRDKFLPTKFSISKFYDVNGFRNYWYEFQIKNIEKSIRIDSRADHNKMVYKNFLPPNFDELAPEEQTNAEERAEKREWNYRVKFSGFLNRSISFQYVPAIKGESFFSYLYGKTILLILSNEQNSIAGLEKEKSAIENWEKTIKKANINREKRINYKKANWRKARLKEIIVKIDNTAKLKKSISSLEEEINQFSKTLFSSAKFLDSEFKVGDDLREFFENFDIGTGNEKNISLRLRGDGIQARFIPQILDFLDSIQTDKKYFLWGFEEPENSSEYKNQQKLALSLKETFSIDKQIFITTHSEEFLSIYDGAEINKEKRKANLYHVKKISNKKNPDFSSIRLFDVEKQIFEFSTTKSEIEEDLGTSLIRAKYSKELKEKEENFLKEKEELEKQNSPILFVEGEFEEKLFKKILGKKCKFQIKSAGCANGVADKVIGSSYIDSQHKILGLFDHDSAGKTAVSKISNSRKTNAKVKNEYIVPNNRMVEILQKQGVEYSIDELLPDFVWNYLNNNNFLTNVAKFDKRAIPPDKSLDDYLTDKFPDDPVAVLKVSKKIMKRKKTAFQKYILNLRRGKFTEVHNSLKPTLENIEEFFK